MKHRRTLCACAGSVSRSAKRPRHTSSCCCGPLHTCTHIIPIKCFHEYIIINNGSKYSQVLLSILNYFLFTFFSSFKHFYWSQISSQWQIEKKCWREETRTPGSGNCKLQARFKLMDFTSKTRQHALTSALNVMLFFFPISLWVKVMQHPTDGNNYDCIMLTVSITIFKQLYAVFSV